MNKTEYIVTGAAGHLGSCVVQALLAQGRRVRALVLPNETCPDFIDENRHLLREYTGDVRDPTSLMRVFEDGHPQNETPQSGPSQRETQAEPYEYVVIHCAGIVAITKKEDRRVYDVNVGGTVNIIEMCKRFNVKRLVYVSSVHAIPPLPRGQVMREVESFDPDAVPGYYDKTKAIATQLVLNAVKDGLDAVVVHPAGIIGPHGLPTGNMARLITLFILGKLPAAIHGGFDFVDVRDVAVGTIAAAEKGESGECYILSNRFVKLKELLDTLSQVSAIKKLKFYLPLWVAKAIAPFAEMHYKISRKTPLFTRYSLKTISENGIYSHDKASRNLGYRTRPLLTTLADTASWVKANT